MKIHFLVYVKWVNFKMYKLYLNKAVFQKKKNLSRKPCQSGGQGERGYEDNDRFQEISLNYH